MAISDSIPDVTVTIQVGDEALQEYIGNEDDGLQSTVTRYIQVAPNMNFEIHADLHAIPSNLYREDDPPKEDEIRLRPQFGLAWCIFVDGKELDSVLVYDRMAKAYYSAEDTCLSRGVRSRGNEVRPYQFSAIEEGGSKNDKLSEEKLEQLGSIRIIVHHVQILNLVRQKIVHEDDVSTLDEASVKGKDIVTSVSLGEAARASASVYIEAIPIDPDNPVATYEFLYRSRAELQNLSIIPRDPQPERQPDAEDEDEDRDLETMTQEEQLAELKRLRAAARERGAETIRIKEEIRENASRAGGHRRKTPTTVIVLGDDGEIQQEYQRPAKSQNPARPTMVLD
ncbi:uncharacterized protein MYCFIDRAFT_214817 [Pseudocercospora fijiensis CIRAD86]|uniref:DUF7918 domain-containing protein n=1 Tax=Pseudocercospora fijiensis (strain CIRAD86) TaxID=383855 RepID=M3A0H9_PSEFD|nr:uncharacterized protein MYCFIDRAFT_214817 [Pseudocercospora fijiensis CIRAD86]EME84659.1 hypothetical protein MYCFIDRAFT_214817 [Pseudocercospora fijiensis CIRAD86]